MNTSKRLRVAYALVLIEIEERQAVRRAYSHLSLTASQKNGSVADGISLDRLKKHKDSSIELRSTIKSTNNTSSNTTDTTADDITNRINEYCQNIKKDVELEELSSGITIIITKPTTTITTTTITAND